MRKKSVGVISEVHSILGDGEIKSCKKGRHIQCSGCCQFGGWLIEGEFEYLKDKIPKDVRLTIEKVENCLGENGCLLEENKPIQCKAYPIEISWRFSFNPSYYCDPNSSDCPIEIEERSTEKVQEAVNALNATSAS